MKTFADPILVVLDCDYIDRASLLVVTFLEHSGKSKGSKEPLQHILAVPCRPRLYLQSELWLDLPVECFERGVLERLDVQLSTVVLRFWDRGKRMVECLRNERTLHHVKVLRP